MRWCFINDFVKALPYLASISAFLIAIWKWVFDALKEERDHYQEKCEKQEGVIDDLKQKNLDLQQKIDEQKFLIDQYVKRMPKNEDGGKDVS